MSRVILPLSTKHLLVNGNITQLSIPSGYHLIQLHPVSGQMHLVPLPTLKEAAPGLATPGVIWKVINGQLKGLFQNKLVEPPAHLAKLLKDQSLMAFAPGLQKESAAWVHVNPLTLNRSYELGSITITMLTPVGQSLMLQPSPFGPDGQMSPVPSGVMGFAVVDELMVELLDANGRCFTYDFSQRSVAKGPPPSDPIPLAVGESLGAHVAYHLPSLGWFVFGLTTGLAFYLRREEKKWERILPTKLGDAGALRGWSWVSPIRPEGWFLFGGKEVSGVPQHTMVAMPGLKHEPLVWAESLF